MKKVCLLLLIASLLSPGALASIRFAAGEGSWDDPASWDGGAVPPLTTTEELKITRSDNICRVDSNVGIYTNQPYVSIAYSASNPATMEVLPDGYLSVGEFRVGPAGATSDGSTGIVTQTGGTLSVKDLLLGRFSADKPPSAGYYIISGGTLTYNDGSTGRLYVGAGNKGGYVEGAFTVIGSDATIQMDSLYVGSDGSNYGKGTLEFQIGAAGVSAIETTDGVTLGTVTAPSITLLEVSTEETTLADTDIVLVQTTGVAAVSGQFDAVNGDSGDEGTIVLLADNLYTLSYQYNADGSANDIALVYLMGVEALASNPNPANGADVETSLAALSWTNPDPNYTGGSITCEVYLGTEPNRLSMDSASLDPGEFSVAINTTNFENYGSLEDQKTYYWAVDCTDSSTGALPPGLMWVFNTDNNNPPTVDAGPDQTTWLGRFDPNTVTLEGTADDLDQDPSTLIITWTRTAGPNTAVIDPSDDLTTTVTFIETGVYEFTLTAEDNVGAQGSDTVRVVVGEDACDASHVSTGEDYDPGDVNADCIVDLVDFMTLIADNWLDCTDEQTNCGN